jgi:hypothetical protein
MKTPRIEYPDYFSEPIFSLSKIRPCSMASDIVLNFLASTEEPVLSCNQVRILGSNVMDNLTLLTSFSNLAITTYESARKHINIVTKITYNNAQNIISDVKKQQNNMKDEDEMNEGESLYF